MHNVNSLRTFIVFLIRVSVPCAPASGRTIMPFTENHILL